MSSAADLYHLVLFLHLASVVAAFSIATLLHLAHHRLRTATHAGPALDAAMLTRRAAPAMPLLSLALFATGGWLTQTAYTWRTPWVDWGAGGLILMMVVSLTILKPRMQAIGRTLATAGVDALPADITARLRDRLLSAAAHVQLGLASGILFVMVIKPAASGCAIALAAGVAVALVVALPERRTASAAATGPVAADA
ncbi:MAG TPA: hypothetical protein VLC11_04515 [Gemmatimonadales bacterium]|nr:hypothetical protein [Gemmatimonadales bacterium]